MEVQYQMKKVLSIILAALMLLTVGIPVFADDSTYTATFKSASASLPYTDQFGPAYYFVKTENGVPLFEEDPNGLYYLANDGRYHTREELIEDTIPVDATTYSPVRFATDTPITLESNTNLSFIVQTNEVYNVATASVFINGVLATQNEAGEYVVYVDRDFNIEVKEGNSLLRNHFNVVLTSGEGYSVRTLQGENYRVAYYGDSFRFRVRIASGYSDADMKVTLVRGENDLAQFLGDDADLLARISGDSETLSSDGVDSEGCRTYTIKNITSNCKIIVSGVREKKKADILTYLKRILKMILDVFHIDTSFLGLDDVVSLAYYTVNINENVPAGTDLDYIMITGTTDPFKMNQFNVMSGESVTIDFVTYDESVKDRLKVTWDPGNTGGVYSNVWTAKLNRATGKVYYTTTFMIDNIRSTTNVNITLN